MAWKPSLWASVIPRDPRERKPNHYLEMARVAWENRGQIPFAWRILRHGVCDGCALGTAGLKDWTLEGVHLWALASPGGLTARTLIWRAERRIIWKRKTVGGLRTSGIQVGAWFFFPEDTATPFR